MVSMDGIGAALKRFRDREKVEMTTPREDCPWYGRKFRDGEDHCALSLQKCKPTKSCVSILNDTTPRTPVWGRVSWYR